MKTKVINLFAGPGCGKSTLAAGLFFEMKKLGLNVELVSEFVKSMAWDGQIPGSFDQLYISGQQSKLESRLYNKVQYIITDSPLLLGACYDDYYNEFNLVEDVIIKFINKANNLGIEHCNFLLERNVPYYTEGRFETENEANLIDSFIKNKLIKLNTSFKILPFDSNEQIKYILHNIVV